jgi:hypothetical protein
MVEIKQNFIKKGRRNRPATCSEYKDYKVYGLIMKPTTITIHNAYTSGSAKNLNTYVRGNEAANRPASWHFSVDEKEIWQSLPLNEPSWHAGDGVNGSGNLSSISIEIVDYAMLATPRNEKLYLQAEEHAAKLCAYLIKTISTLKPFPDCLRQHWHWSKKNCPQWIRARSNGWQEFIDKVSKYLNQSIPTPPPSPGTIYRVICGSFITWDEADARMELLDKNGIDNFPAGYIHNGTTYIRIVAGAFDNETKRLEHQQLIKNKTGLETFAVPVWDVVALPPRDTPDLTPDPPSPPTPSPNLTPIIGEAKATLAQAREWMRQVAPDWIEVADLFYAIAPKYNIRPDILLAQSCKETGYFRYNGIVKPWQNNFGGIAATGTASDGNTPLYGADPDKVRFEKGVHGAIFASKAVGVEAQVQHLFAYATKEPLPEWATLYSPRFALVQRGTAPYVEHLGAGENPAGVGWAYPGDDYGKSIVNDYLNKLLAVEVAEPPVVEPPVVEDPPVVEPPIIEPDPPVIEDPPIITPEIPKDINNFLDLLLAIIRYLIDSFKNKKIKTR